MTRFGLGLNAGVAFGTDGKRQHGTDALPMALKITDPG